MQGALLSCEVLAICVYTLEHVPSYKVFEEAYSVIFLCEV